MSPKANRLWGIVLAAGDGTQLQSFLQQQGGERGIEQICKGVGHRSVLQHTLAQVELLIPRERILVVVDQEYNEEAAQQLADWPTDNLDNLIVQPFYCGTVPGILLALAHLSHRDPFATVAVFPAGQSVRDEERLNLIMASVRQAADETQRFPRQLTILGMTPDTAPNASQNTSQDGYDWIEPGTVLNTTIYVAEAATLWEMVRQTQPELYADFMHLRRVCGQPHATHVTEGIYSLLAFLPPQSPLDFLPSMCELLPHRLRVLPVPAVEKRAVL